MGCGRVLEACALGCSAAPQPRCLRPVPSNGVTPPGQAQTADVIVKGSSVLDACSGDLDGAAIAGASFTTRDQVNGPRLGMVRVRSVRIEAGGRLRVLGSCALALVSDRNIEIAGLLDLSAGLNTIYGPGPGGSQGAFTGAAVGCGKGGNPTQLGGGGGGGAFAGAGGTGGSCGGTEGGGKTCGTETLQPLIGGSGGGRGGCKTACSSGYGGGGGGAVALVAGHTIKVVMGGGINVGGAGGSGGLEGSSGGGGGGSGGAILLEAPLFQLEPGGWLAAAGGGGGGVASTDAETANGATGSLAGAAAAGGAGVTAGGDGSAEASSGDGIAGAEGTGWCGGGGAGWGRIRINSAAGTVEAPSVHGALSQGQLPSS